MEIKNLLKRKAKTEKRTIMSDYMTSGFVMRVESSQGFVSNLDNYMANSRINNR